MKNIKVLLSALVLSASVFTTSCSDDFLDTIPSSGISDEVVFSSVENLAAAVNGMHRNMYSRQNESQGQNGYTAQMIIFDAMGEDLIFPTVGPNWFVSQLQWTDSSNESAASISYPWHFWYAMIKNANFIIERGPGIEGDAKIREQAIGEAYAYRAFSYFQLTQIYGKRFEKGTANDNLSVVIRTDPKDNAPKARATVAEVYAQVNADIAKAETLLKGKAIKNKSHFNINNVKGIKARIALAQGEWKVAAEEARIARNSYSFMEQKDYKAGFNDYTNSEWMWGITILPDQTDYFGNFGAYLSRNYNSSAIRQSPKVINNLLHAKFAQTDIRAQNFDPTGEHTDLNLPSNYSKFPFTAQKFLTKTNGESVMDVPFMRSAEMYLIEAEALYRDGNEAASKTVLAELIAARDTNFAGFTTSGDDYLTQLLDNRRIELWGEGFRWFDLKRLGLKLDRSGANHVSTVINNTYIVQPNDTRWQWLIPKSELNSNPLMVQNPS